jgi:PadR family transcriptional regulator, regulatory protein AphA
MERSMSGYDIKKHVQNALGAVTNASYGTLYPTLHKLLAEGSVEMQEVPQKGRPSKKLYYITNKGREELQAWLRQPPAADQIRREFLLKLYLASHMTAQELLMILATRRGETEAALKNLHAKRDSANDPKRAWVINYELSLCKAEIDWLDQIETQIAAD